MGMVMLPPGVTWQQYNDWLQNSPQGQQHSQYVNQASAGLPHGVSHSPPMLYAGQSGGPMPQGPAAGAYQGASPFGGALGNPPRLGGRRPSDDPYADVRELMQQYPGVDPNELRRFRDQLQQAERDDAAERFRRDSASVAPEYERQRRAANQESAEAMRQSLQPQQGGYGARAFSPGMAQPIQPQSYGTPYGAPSPWGPAWFGGGQEAQNAAPAQVPQGGGQPPKYQAGPGGRRWF